MGPPIVYLIPTKWLWNPHVGKLKKYIVGMGMCKIIEQTGKFDPKNLTKTVIPKKWVIVTSNWRHYGHPFITSPNLDENLTSLKHCEPLFHTHHELLHQIDEE
jgi:hypothetical protein